MMKFNNGFVMGFTVSLKIPFQIILFLILFSGAAEITRAQNTNKKNVYHLKNDLIETSITVENGSVSEEKIFVKKEFAEKYKSKPASIVFKADFAVDLMWTSWSAPGKKMNADNNIILTKNDFLFEEGKAADDKTLELFFKGNNVPLILKITYRLDEDKFYLKRKIAVKDTLNRGHFLRFFTPFSSPVSNIKKIVNNGGFGQPVAFELNSGGAFIGLEYPASTNSAAQTKSADKNTIHITCQQEYGETITKEWLESDWVVTALTPNSYVKEWFEKYIDDIRVRPLKPYSLYNSWYDLRAADYPIGREFPEGVPEESIMNEENIMRIIKLIKKNMIEKNKIKLDAFVLDDGWDVYKSDWVIRAEQFPNGLKPIADELKKTDTELGIWFGPTGGYSARMQRIDWMKENGYEVLGEGKSYSMLCLAGKKYSELFEKRAVDFVVNDGVKYFKWDGIQFSCSQPDHGHAVDIYSRRAVLKSVEDKCTAVRTANPDAYLNITSGTWLSPWWLKYADQIWMQGMDYGYADVPSISPRDASITYRDLVLYEDFQDNKFWFPISNLMTHGIIKGTLQKLGGEEEPLDKFTDNAVLYFARGVTMYELYISPDILTDGEWDAISKSLAWARENFPILSKTEMIGGDPKKRETYGYTHFAGKKGIVAVRNPYIKDEKISVELSPSQGLDPEAAGLVVEKIYPTRMIYNKLFKAGDKVEIPLDGYETAVFQVYPVSEADYPLLAGVVYDELDINGKNYGFGFYNQVKEAKVLNPDKIDYIEFNGKKIAPKDLKLKETKNTLPVNGITLNKSLQQGGLEINSEFTVDESCEETILAILPQPAEQYYKTPKPQLTVELDGQTAEVKLENKSEVVNWYTVKIPAGKHSVKVILSYTENMENWKGNLKLWLVIKQKQNASSINFVMKNDVSEKILPPLAWPKGIIRKNIKLGEVEVNI